MFNLNAKVLESLHKKSYFGLLGILEPLETMIMPPTQNPSALEPPGLVALAARLRQDLAWLDLPAKPWTIPREYGGKKVLDVAIIGGGMSGMAASASLGLAGIAAVMFDRAPAGFEGPWVTTARMETLRSPKQLTGPALGLPALTFRAWFEAQFGMDAWDALDKIPRTQWMDYLRWYRHVLNLDLRNEHHVTKILPRDDGMVQLEVMHRGSSETIFARRAVIATGRAGLGGAYVPDFAHRISRDLWAHSSDPLDYSTLAGKRVGVIGAGASAMDSAATALEMGAASVDMLIRRDDIPRINKGKGANNPGWVTGFYGLPDSWKWKIRHYINRQQVPPPRGSTLRVSKFANARFNLGCPIDSVAVHDQVLHVKTPKGIFELDFLIFSTGFQIDWLARPEYGAIAPFIRSWADRFTPEQTERDEELSGSPDVGPDFELREKIPGSCKGLSNILCFCYPATLSHGQISGDIPAISDGAKRLTQGIVSQFYREDIEQYYEKIQSFAEPEVFGDEWTVAPPPEGRVD